MSTLNVSRLVLSEVIVAGTRPEGVLKRSLFKMQKAHNISHTDQASIYRCSAVT